MVYNIYMTNIDFSSIEITATIISGYVLGITALAKTGGVQSRYLPYVAILSAMGLSALILGLVPTAVFVGIQASLMASGLHSNISAVVDKKDTSFNG